MGSTLKFNPVPDRIGEKPTFLVTPKQFDNVSETINQHIEKRLNQIQPRRNEIPVKNDDSLYSFLFGSGYHSIIVIGIAAHGLACFLPL